MADTPIHRDNGELQKIQRITIGYKPLGFGISHVVLQSYRYELHFIIYDLNPMNQNRL
jgi:hypothetical protein